jgi:hypothetical protein
LREETSFSTPLGEIKNLYKNNRLQEICQFPG